MTTLSAMARHRFSASPVAFLMTITFLNWIGFATWQALLNNFAKEAAGFTGWEIGILQSVREIPGFLAFTAIFWFMLMREQTLAYFSLVVLGIGVAATGFFPSVPGLLVTTFVMSVGFHYFETANQALALQLLPKAETPKVLGLVAGAAAAAQLAGYGLLAIAARTLQPGYEILYFASGALTVMLAVLAMSLFSRFEGPVPQRKEIVLRRRYWLYYALTFMSGARRQLFMAFGGWLLVERFGYDLSSLSILFFIYCSINIVAGPVLGRLVGRLGERATIMVENISLIVVFLGYATTASWLVAGALFVMDGVFFTLTIAQRTYFQKIADPADIAPTASVAFTINHIAAVFIPVVFGLVWLRDPAIVFQIGAVMAAVSLSLAFLVPRTPLPGNETILAGSERPLPAE
ncbi:MAG TPA: MFS transporter [Beijerinckiaceae bacterium]|jgi:predicted MFS family arabinose efflux permease